MLEILFITHLSSIRDEYVEKLKRCELVGIVDHAHVMLEGIVHGPGYCEG